jgi:hypothetical protein
MQTMIEKLELIARCLRGGVEIQWRETAGGGWSIENFFEFKNEIHVMGSEYEYRAKPVNPRIIYQQVDGIFTTVPQGTAYYQGTPEVRAALEAAGIEI